MSKSLKQEIIDYVKSSKQVTLKDLYTKFDQTKDSTEKNFEDYCEPFIGRLPSKIDF